MPECCAKPVMDTPLRKKTLSGITAPEVGRSAVIREGAQSFASASRTMPGVKSSGSSSGGLPGTYSA